MYGTQLWAFECLAQLFSMVANPILGLMLFMQVWFMAFLFTGIAVPIENVLWPFRVLCYSLPYRWALTSMIFLAFYYTPPYDGVCRCNVTSELAVNVSSGSSCDVFWAWQDSSAPIAGSYAGGVLVTPYCNAERVDEDGYGFFCPEAEPFACFGRTGSQILTSIEKNYRTINDQDNWFRYTLIVLAMALVLKTSHTVSFSLKCAEAQTPQPAGRGRVANTSGASTDFRGIMMRGESTPATHTPGRGARTNVDAIAQSKTAMQCSTAGSCLSNAI